MGSEARTELNEYLKSMEFKLAGDCVLLPSKCGFVQEILPSEKAVVVKVPLVVKNDPLPHFDSKGIRLERFRKNPVVLFNHRYDGLPIARSLWERVREVDGVLTLIAKAQFHLDTELSRDTWYLLKEALEFECGLGVLPYKWDPGPEDAAPCWFVTEWDLLEYSFVLASAARKEVLRLEEERKVSAPALVKDAESCVICSSETCDLAQQAESGKDVVPVQEERCSFLEAVKSDIAYAKESQLSRAGILGLMQARVEEYEEKE